MGVEKIARRRAAVEAQRSTAVTIYDLEMMEIDGS